jgi:hypothetical protein
MEQEKISTEIVIDCHWTSAQDGPAEVAQTSCLLEIRVGDRFLTRVDNDFSGSVTNMPPLSAYPIALWLAASWWRLRWEASPVADSAPSLQWRTAHEIASAGQGLVWPPVTIASDGDTVVLSVAPRTASFEPLRYLHKGQLLVDGTAFERALDRFIEKVVARLSERGVVTSQLQELWAEIAAERRDSEIAPYRRMEAILGFEPDEGDERLIQEFLKSRSRAGTAALDEIAYASSLNGGAQDTLRQATEIAARLDLNGKMTLPEPVLKMAQKLPKLLLAPWEIGRKLADEFRQQISNNSAPVSNRDFSGIFGLPARRFQTSSQDEGLPISLAVVREGKVGVNFRKARSTGKRFEAARLLGDFALSGAVDAWLPATDAATYRQKIQRAFAAQFLCPIDALLSYLSGRISDESVEAAARHFDVSPLAVHSHLVNNRIPGANFGALMHV